MASFNVSILFETPPKLYLKFDALETQALDIYLQDLHLRRMQGDAA